MNCKMNREILNLDCVDDLFIQPAANDSGICLGAALEAFYRVTGKKPNVEYENVYFGPKYSNNEVYETLSEYKIEFEQKNDISTKVAELLAEGYLVGWFQGRMEYGARALGNRSILANPTKQEYMDKVNSNVKGREAWRPFAPSMLYEARNEYLVHGDEAPFMILLDGVDETKRKEIPAVTHVDGTTRPQTVREESNPKYYNMIKNSES
nr:carbamoyltransferase C-terminal domain-containing protein [Halobellus sp. DFY28]